MKGNILKNVMVVFGGKSCERDVSVITGVLTLNCIDRQKYNPIPVYITDSGWYTGDALFDVAFYKSFDESKVKKVILTLADRFLYTLQKDKIKRVAEIYCAVNCCHGLNGEDGCIAGVMRLAGIPFASPDMLSSSLCIDKAAIKPFLKGIGVNVLPCRVITKGAFFQNREMAVTLAEHSVGYPCVVKPARLGSSIGIKWAEDREGLFLAIEHALRYDSKIIVEKAADNGFKEINCAAYRCGGRIVTSDCEMPVTSGKILSFADKYCGGKGGADRQFPADISEELSRKIRDTTSLVYRKIFAVGVIRIDYIVVGEEVYLNEVNTVPGSLALYLFKNKTSEFGEVLTEIIEEGVKERRDFDNGTFTYPSAVLDGVGSKTKGAKRG